MRLDVLAASPEHIRRHVAWLDPGTARRPGEMDLALATALLKIEEVPPESGLMATLTRPERLAILKNPFAILRLRDRLVPMGAEGP